MSHDNDLRRLLLRREWTSFRTRGRALAVLAAMLVMVAGAVLAAMPPRASCSQGTVETPCPADPIGPQGAGVTDRLAFAHRTLEGDGSITARLTSFTGIITYPPPDHDEIVAGLVPWAKTGVIIKDGTSPGSRYAALMMTGRHGVHLQHDYVNDVEGSAGAVIPKAPRWLRLTRAGELVTGEESPDGSTWTTVGSVHLAGLPTTVEIGLFATSPGDQTLRSTALGASTVETRFTQASGTFDHVLTTGAVSPNAWGADLVGEMGATDWERLHRAPGLTVSGDTLTVTGSGDIGPVGEVGEAHLESLLPGLPIALLILIAVAASARHGGASPRRRVRARAAVVAAAGLGAGLIGTGASVVVGLTLATVNGTPMAPTSWLTELRVVAGVGALAAASCLIVLAAAELMGRRRAAAALSAVALVLLHLVTALPLLPDEVARWILRVTPAAGFSVTQTRVDHPQVLAHTAPFEGFYPLPWWAGLAVTWLYAVGATAMVIRRRPRPSGLSGERTHASAPRSKQTQEVRGRS
jgi:hypothetical protein